MNQSSKQISPYNNNMLFLIREILLFTKRDRYVLLNGLGILLFGVGFFLAYIERISPIMETVIETMALLLIGYSVYHLTNLKKVLSDKKISLFMLIVAIWYLFVISTGLPHNYQELKKALFSYNNLLIYLVPVFTIMAYNKLAIYSSIFKTITLFNIVYLLLFFTFLSDIIDLFNFGPLEYLNKFICYSNLLLILCLRYIDTKQKIISIIVYIVSLLLVIYQARRNQIFTIGITGIFAIILYMYQSKNTKIRIALILTAIIGSFFIVSFYDPESILFSTLSNRISEDSRSSIENAYWKDMQTEDLILGRGINGTYYCPMVENSDSGEMKYYRDTIETGYMDIILKSGSIGLIIFLGGCLTSIILGLFYSKNHLSKALALFILVYMLELYPAGNPTFSFRYILIWIAFGFLLHPKLRRLSNSAIFIHLRNYR